MSKDPIDYASRGGVAAITINRPAKRRALSARLCGQLAAADDARFICPGANLGVGAGLVSALVAPTLHKIVTQLMLPGGPISVQRAHETGIFNRVVLRGRERAEALQLARDFRPAPWHACGRA